MRCSPPPSPAPEVPRRRLLAGATAAAGLVALTAASRVARAERRHPELLPPAPLPQFSLAVAEIRIIPAYATSPGAAAENAVPFTPKTALETWAKTHVRAVGQRGRAEIVIRDASITAKRVPPKTRDWRDWFRRQPVERYDAVLELELLIRDDAGTVRARTVARATHARFLMDDHREYQRERIIQLQSLTDEIIAAALKRLEAELRTNMREWVR